MELPSAQRGEHGKSRCIWVQLHLKASGFLWEERKVSGPGEPAGEKGRRGAGTCLEWAVCPLWCSYSRQMWRQDRDVSVGEVGS